MILRLISGMAGVTLVIGAFADLTNTLVTTHTSHSNIWFTQRLYGISWRVVSRVARRMTSDRMRNGLLSTYAPVSVLALLVGWIVQQVIGWGLIWYAIGGVAGAKGLGDSMYFSGVVYFTVGFGEIVPADAIPRIGALAEAFSGVLTTALVIGYLPSLFSAYADRERRLMSLDDGTEQRITPVNLILARAIPGDPSELDDFFAEWESWTAGVLATHSSFPMLRLFRSQQPTQHWITALGLVCDAASLAHGVLVDEYRSAVWMLRRGTRLFDELTTGVDLSAYQSTFESELADNRVNPFFEELHNQLTAAGFAVRDQDEAFARTIEFRRRYSPQMEYLIDELFAPRGFWPHAIGHPTFFLGQTAVRE